MLSPCEVWCFLVLSSIVGELVLGMEDVSFSWLSKGLVEDHSFFYSLIGVERKD